MLTLWQRIRNYIFSDQMASIFHSTWYTTNACQCAHCEEFRRIPTQKSNSWLSDWTSHNLFPPLVRVWRECPVLGYGVTGDRSPRAGKQQAKSRAVETWKVPNIINQVRKARKRVCGAQVYGPYPCGACVEPTPSCTCKGREAVSGCERPIDISAKH